MTTRSTSRESYRLLVESGELMGQQMEILDLLIERGPGTAAETIKGSKYDRNRNLARARFTELQARGLIQECERRTCEVTGRLALVWEATGRTKPLDPNRSKGVSKKTLAATLVRICGLCEDAVGVIDSEGLDLDEEGVQILAACKEARTLAARA